jgi:hypothetical protein
MFDEKRKKQKASKIDIFLAGDGNGCLIVSDTLNGAENPKLLRQHAATGDTVTWHAPAGTTTMLIAFPDTRLFGVRVLVGTAVGSDIEATGTVAATPAISTRFKYGIVLVTGVVPTIEDPQIIVD